MRRWLFVLLIMLLPLRGWVGDAMAMQMALPGQHAPASALMPHANGKSESAHTSLRTVASAGAGDCAGHTSVQVKGDEADAAHCEACAMCQTCHTVAVLQPPDVLPIAEISATSQPIEIQGFASADRVLFLKPPNY